jgi:CBS domain-containing protein
MQVRDIMTRDVQTISPEATLEEAARKMRAFDIGFIPVVDDDGRAIGTLTDRDITVRATAEGFNPRDTKVGDVMTADVVCCNENEDISKVAKVMEDRQIRRILVCDQNRQPIGIVSLGDLALDSGDLQLTGEIIHEVSRHGW